MAPKPSEVRALILREHVELRGLLVDVEHALQRASQDTGARAQLQGKLAFFCERFLAHIAQEEKILEPVLADIDNWGPVRIEQMEAEHAQQRATIHDLVQLRPETDLASYADRVRGFLREVLTDMAAEEHECLSPDVLRDDTINIDAFGG